MEKLISVIMPVYNREKFIHQAINSVINQTYKNWEFIIVDDHSKDNTWEILKQFAQKDKRIKIFRNEKNSGSSASRNKGIEKANGEFIIFLDSDDYFKDFAFEQRINFFEKFNDFDFLVFKTLRYNKQTGQTKPWNDHIDPDPLKQFLNLDPTWQTMSPIWKTKAILENNLRFDTNILGIEDAVFHIEALAKGLKFKIIDQAPPDSIYVEHLEESLSQKGFSFKQRKGHLHFFKTFLEDDLLNENYKQILEQKFDTFIQTIAEKKEGRTILKILTSPYWLKKLKKEQKKLLKKVLAKKILNKIGK